MWKSLPDFCGDSNSVSSSLTSESSERLAVDAVPPLRFDATDGVATFRRTVEPDVVALGRATLVFGVANAAVAAGNLKEQKQNTLILK